jgi:hypothetical protein
MSSSHILEFQTAHQDSVPGFWKLAPGRVLSLQPLQTDLLRVAQGQVWVTLDVEHQGAGNELGDHFLRAGEQLAVKSGQHLVLEPFAHADQQAVFFEWTPVSETEQSMAIESSHLVTQPLRELVRSIGRVGSALAHLCAGVVVYCRKLVSGRAAAVQVQHCS